MQEDNLQENQNLDKTSEQNLLNDEADFFDVEDWDMLNEHIAKLVKGRDLIN